MSPTLFDSESERRRKQGLKLREQLSELIEEDQTGTEAHSMPQREEHHPHKKHHAPRDPREYSEVLRLDASNSGMFASYCPLPENARFETQQEKEQILLLLRQHPLVNLRWVLLTIFFLFIPTLARMIFPFSEFVPAQFSFFFQAVWFFLVLAFAVESFIGWYYNIYIVTDERIIDVDFYSLIYKSVSEAKIEKIEDVTATTAGVLGAMFDYGTLTLQTAAEQREFDFANVPHPAKVMKFLNELILEEEREKIEGRVH